MILDYDFWNFAIDVMEILFILAANTIFWPVQFLLQAAADKKSSEQHVQEVGIDVLFASYDKLLSATSFDCFGSTK